MKMKHTLIAAAAVGLLSTGAQAVDWGGYVRVGPGQKQNSGDSKRCFSGGEAAGFGSQAPGRGGIGRLGNECETYGEFGLSQTMTAGGVNYKALLMTNFFKPGSDVAGTTTAVNQMYVEGKGYDIAPNQTFWIGRRFYHRADVHFDDSFYVNMSGTGAGVDGIDVGVGSLSLAVFRTSDAASTDNAGTRLNVDLEGINVNPGGKLRLTAAFTDFSGPGGENGAGLSLQHNQANLFGANNTLWLQWSKGSTWLDMGFAGATSGSDSKRWRIADSLAWLKGPLTAQTLVHYGQIEQPTLAGDYKAKTFSVAGRVAYALTNNFKLQGELGFASTKPDLAGVSGDKQNVTKFTIAPTLTVGPNYYDRPELRFYVSAFSMNDAYKNATGQSKKSKTAAGFQAEIWF
ncbi:MAG: carbohydrate porin [Piscinibacter sp.]|uniref:maltoporin n=1 Tax=Piscinibacter TaxID=1114981 RepID=UPI000FDE2CC9|nr:MULTISPECIES: carbohydrate porin [Piscinibacter]MCW5664179.1 carbohydrate porin [Piscinibacter sp.]